MLKQRKNLVKHVIKWVTMCANEMPFKWCFFGGSIVVQDCMLAVHVSIFLFAGAYTLGTSQHFFCHIGTFPGLNPDLAWDKVKPQSHEA